MQLDTSEAYNLVRWVAGILQPCTASIAPFCREVHGFRGNGRTSSYDRASFTVSYDADVALAPVLRSALSGS